eukprot:10354980-Alexandrium_andersonii.AAC.1
MPRLVHRVRRASLWLRPNDTVRRDRPCRGGGWPLQQRDRTYARHCLSHGPSGGAALAVGP